MYICLRINKYWLLGVELFVGGGYDCFCFNIDDLDKFFKVKEKKIYDWFFKRIEVLEGVVDFEDGWVCLKLIVCLCGKYLILGVYLFFDRYIIC